MLLLLAVSFTAFSQQQGLYIYGAVLEADSLEPLAGATIKNINSNVALQADEEGNFKIEVSPGDTLQIVHMYFRPARYYVPAELEASRYALIQLLEREDDLQTDNLREFPTQMQFEQTLMQVDPGNLTNRTTELDLHLEQVTHDPTNMQQYLDDYRRHHRLYVLPQEGAINYAPNDLINPDRWRNFIRDWREGRFTEEAIERLEGFPGGIDNDDDGE